MTPALPGGDSLYLVEATMDAQCHPNEPEHQSHKLFLALTLIESKPAGSQLSEYVERFRESVFLEMDERHHITQTQAKEVAHWKSIHVESQTHAAKLKEKLEALEQQQVDMTMQLAKEQATRKQLDDAVTPRRHPALVQTQYSQPMDVLQDQKHIRYVLDELEMRTASPDVSAYLKHLYVLQKQLGQSEQGEGNLSRCIAQLSFNICEILQETIRMNPETKAALWGSTDSPMQSETRTPPLRKESRARIQLIKRTFELIAAACARVAKEEGNHRYWDQTVSHITQIFQQLLDAISKVGASKVHDTTPVVTRRTETGDITTSDEAPTPPSTEAEMAPILCAELSSAAVLMISSFTSIGSSVGDIINGYLHILFTKTGSLLSHTMYKGRAGTPVDQEVNGGFNAADARSLVWILERTMALIRPYPRQEHNGDHQSLITVSAANNIGDEHLPFSTMLESFQNTVLQKIFTNDKLFANRLLPTPVVDAGPCFLQDDLFEGSALWFESEIWRLICWDTIYNRECT